MRIISQLQKALNLELGEAKVRKLIKRKASTLWIVSNLQNKAGELITNCSTQKIGN